AAYGGSEEAQIAAGTLAGGMMGAGVMMINPGGRLPIGRAGKLGETVSLSQAVKVNRYLDSIGVDKHARRSFLKTGDVDGLAGWISARDVELPRKLDVDSPEMVEHLRSANTHEIYEGRKLAPIGHSGLNENLQLAIMESLPPDVVGVFRDRAYAYGIGKAKPAGAKTLQELNSGGRFVKLSDGTEALVVSDLDPYAFTDLNGNLLSNDEAIALMNKIEKNFQIREFGSYDKTKRYVNGEHGDQVNGEWGQWPGTETVKARNEVVYTFSNNGFMQAERANTFKNRLPLQLSNRKRAMYDRLMYEFERMF
ncbi:MAG: hypothetical protein NXI24_17605, partial [bacterium]|nr:hypothetical protein [bacterium]